MPNPDQKLAAQEAIQQALAFMNSIEDQAQKDQYQEIPRLLSRLDGALFDLRQSLQVQDPASAAIMDEYEEDP